MALVNSILGIDIGGTKISMGIVSNGKVVQSIILKTPANEAKEKIVQFIIKGIESLPGYNDIVGIGIGSPGLVDEEQGIIFSVQNIPSWNEVPLKQYLSNYFNKPVFITNDANCFAIGVKTFGEGKPYSNLLGLSIGTGLGAGIIIEGGLYSGVNSSAGEVGGLPYLDADYETYCSGKFFKKMYNISGEEASELAEQKNSKCLAMFEEFGIHVGNLIKNNTVYYGSGSNNNWWIGE